MQDVESSSTLQPATELTYIPPHKSSTERLNSTPNNRSTEMLVDKSHSSVENNDYDELPTLAYKNTNSSSWILNIVTFLLLYVCFFEC